MYDSYFATAMRYGMDDYEAAIRPVKRQLFAELASYLTRPASAGSGSGTDGGSGSPPIRRVLEVGVGTGPNYAWYSEALSAAVAGTGAGTATAATAEVAGPTTTAAAAATAGLPRLQVVGLDPSPAMLRFAEESARAAGMRLAGDAGGGGDGGDGIGGGLDVEASLIEGSAEALPFADGEFDAAVVTLVLCSVPSPAVALAELRRVVRPAGRLLLIEHVAAPPARPLLRLAQSALTPLQRLMADGCCLNRDTGAAVRAAGWGGVLREFDLEGMSILAPHVAGLLVR
ncbi:hypothetical protein GPECTOR_4g781 [Gonium pectorale]|uniref:Methyltransferase type 11 domain-containing protein n=1 Tax=Gonium pectorale TaxID=33097 RepID=A0A150GY81_GONPE|nr:hypothetical protein GPECTOR_4g781 [Gonium pectorale]|eukprot:KXZ54713.1 hypothetical protein GPECTOR_4g781 [Gonium pectorale]